MKEIVESWLPIERDWFLAMNKVQTDFLDNMFWVITEEIVWIILLIVVAALFFYKRPWKEGALMLVFLVFAVFLFDQFSSSIFKPYFERLRPTHHPDFKDIVLTVKGYRSKGFSFVSGHATNSFGTALFLSLYYAKRWIVFPIYTWAILFSYSRIYMGLHFITDIVGGMVVGSIIASVTYMLFNILRKKTLKVHSKPLFTAEQSRTAGVIITLYLIAVIILSPFLSTI